jgi:hypothetical protein
VPGTLERTLTPGAETSGPSRVSPPTTTGPRLEKLAMVSLELVAPTVNVDE